MEEPSRRRCGRPSEVSDCVRSVSTRGLPGRFQNAEAACGARAPATGRSSHWTTAAVQSSDAARIVDVRAAVDHGRLSRNSRHANVIDPVSHPGRLAPALLGLEPGWPLVVSLSPSFSPVPRPPVPRPGPRRGPSHAGARRSRRLACRGSRSGRRPAGRPGLAGRRARRRLRAARPRRGPAGDASARSSASSTTTTRSTWACGSSTAARPHREPPPLAPRRAGRRRPLRDLPRPAARPPHRRPLRGERGGRAARRGHLQRHLDGRLVGRGVGLAPCHHDEQGWSVEMRIPFSELRFLRAERQTLGRSTPRASSSARTRATGSRSCRRRESGLASRMADAHRHRGVRPRTPLVVVPYAAGGAETGAADPGRPVPRRPPRVRRASASTCGARSAAASRSTRRSTPTSARSRSTPRSSTSPTSRRSSPRSGPSSSRARRSSTASAGTARTTSTASCAPSRTCSTRGASGARPQGVRPRPTSCRRAARDDDPRRGQAHREERVGWSVGVLEAVTGARERALGERRPAAGGRRSSRSPTTSSGARSATPARAGYGVLLTVGRTATWGPGCSPISLAGRRSTSPGPTATSSSTRAGTGSCAGGSPRASVAGDAEAIEQLQLGSTRYFQRPDRAELRLDPTRTSLDGWTGSVDLNRQSGAVRVNAAAWATSPGFESNDLGFNPRSDRWGGHVAVAAAASRSRTASPASAPSRSRSRTRTTSTATSRATPSTRSARACPPQLLERRAERPLALARARRPADAGRAFDDHRRGRGAAASGWRRDDRRPVVGRIVVVPLPATSGAAGSGTGEAVAELRPSLRARRRDRPVRHEGRDRVAQWVTSREDAALPTDLGGHYVFAAFEQTRARASPLRLSWIFSPRLSLQLYAQPLVSRGDYAGFKELERARSFDFLEYGPDAVAYDARRRRLHGGPGPRLGPVLVRRTPTSTTSRSGSTPSCAGSGGRARRSTPCGPRPARTRTPPATATSAASLDRLLGSPSTNVFEVKATIRVGRLNDPHASAQRRLQLIEMPSPPPVSTVVS